jgi:hypothetical protein
MKYEYKALAADAPEMSERQLNKLGDEGWLLVSVYPRTEKEWIYVFSREKPVMAEAVR